MAAVVCAGSMLCALGSVWLGGCVRFGYESVAGRDGVPLPPLDSGMPDASPGDAATDAGPALDAGSDAAAGDAKVGLDGTVDTDSALVLDGGPDADSGPDGGPDSGPDSGADTGPPPCVESRALINLVDSKITGSFTNFPLLISHTATFLKSVTQGGSVANANGYDIHFTLDDAGATALDHEVEAYDAASGTLVAWVRMPALNSGSELYLRYGCDVAASQERRVDVWSSEFRGVWHLQGDSDATANLNDCTASNVGSQPQGKIGAARSFDGSSSKLTAAASASLDDVFAGGSTVSAWVKPDTSGEQHLGFIVSKIQSTMNCLPCNPDEKGWALLLGPEQGFLSGQSSLDFRQDYSTAAGHWQSAADAWAAGTWTAISVTYSRGGTPKIYVDGVLSSSSAVVSPSGSPTADTSRALVIGNSPDQLRTFDGAIDEVRLTKGERPAAWIRTEFNNQSAPATFYTITPQP